MYDPKGLEVVLTCVMCLALWKFTELVIWSFNTWIAP